MIGTGMMVRRWMAMMFVILPLTFITFTFVARRVARPAEGPHVDDTFWQSLQGLVGFYIGYAVIAGTLASVFHSLGVRWLGSPGPLVSILLGGVLGLLALTPQAAVFGTGYWLSNMVAGMLAGLAYGAIVSIPPFR